MSLDKLNSAGNVEKQRCYDSLDYVFSKTGYDEAQQLIKSMQRRLGELSGQPSQRRINTPTEILFHLKKNLNTQVILNWKQK